MKLKWWWLILLGLNAVVLAWQWDAFARWGYGPNQHREPERLQQQIRPEAMKVERVSPDVAGSASAAPRVAESEGGDVAPPDASEAPRPASTETPSAPPATVSPTPAVADSPNPGVRP